MIETIRNKIRSIVLALLACIKCRPFFAYTPPIISFQNHQMDITCTGGEKNATYKCCSHHVINPEPSTERFSYQFFQVSCFIKNEIMISLGTHGFDALYGCFSVTVDNDVCLHCCPPCAVRPAISLFFFGQECAHRLSSPTTLGRHGPPTGNTGKTTPWGFRYVYIYICIIYIYIYV